MAILENYSFLLLKKLKKLVNLNSNVKSTLIDKLKEFMTGNEDHR